MTRKLADRIDGVDLKGRRVGDIFESPASEAQLLVAEGWAVVVTNRADQSENSGATTDPGAQQVPARNRERVD
ncbi:MAG TPA: hypothetical protein VIK60_12795 [Vicinamibacterales bacterium]